MAAKQQIDIDVILNAYGIKTKSLREHVKGVMKMVQQFDRVFPEYDGESVDLDINNADLDLVNEYQRRVREAAQDLCARVDNLTGDVFSQLVQEYRGF